MACHVDDPFIKCKNLAGQEWIHKQLQSKFDTKGAAYLTPGSSLDYLSIRVTLHTNGDLTLDNQLKIEKYLEEHDLTNCNPAAGPITAFQGGACKSANVQVIRLVVALKGR